MSLPVEVAMIEAAETAIKSRLFIDTIFPLRLQFLPVTEHDERIEFFGKFECYSGGRTIVKLGTFMRNSH
jgi:hypothetical protein